MASLYPSAPLLEAARRKGSAVAALNFYNAETILAHVSAAKALNASIILQTTESTIKYLGVKMIVAMATAAADELDQPISLHLDHGSSYDLAARCIDHGYTSIMIDGSNLPFSENCEITKRVVDLAHASGVSVEGELGHVAHNDDIPHADPTNFYTRADRAAQFVMETNVDALAIAIGTAHGFYKGEVRLDFQRLQEIREATKSTPLVLHGGSGIPDNLIRRAIECGISKINFGTELKNAFTRTIKKTLSATSEIDLRKTFAPAIEAVREVAMEKIRLCSVNQNGPR